VGILCSAKTDSTREFIFLRLFIPRGSVSAEYLVRILLSSLCTSFYSQALGQCGQFIRSHIKDAVLVKTPSTVAAVEAILNDEKEGCSSAAIASSVCERLFDGVQVLYKGVQDEACESGFFPHPSYMEGAWLTF
jgi:hypothetical protein